MKPLQQRAGEDYHYGNQETQTTSLITKSILLEVGKFLLKLKGAFNRTQFLNRITERFIKSLEIDLSYEKTQDLIKTVENFFNNTFQIQDSNTEEDLKVAIHEFLEKNKPKVVKELIEKQHNRTLETLDPDPNLTTQELEENELSLENLIKTVQQIAENSVSELKKYLKELAKNISIEIKAQISQQIRNGETKNTKSKIELFNQYIEDFQLPTTNEKRKIVLLLGLYKILEIDHYQYHNSYGYDRTQYSQEVATIIQLSGINYNKREIENIKSTLADGTLKETQELLDALKNEIETSKRAIKILNTELLKTTLEDLGINETAIQTISTLTELELQKRLPIEVINYNIGNSIEALIDTIDVITEILSDKTNKLTFKGTDEKTKHHICSIIERHLPNISNEDLEILSETLLKYTLQGFLDHRPPEERKEEVTYQIARQLLSKQS